MKASSPIVTGDWSTSCTFTVTSSNFTYTALTYSSDNGTPKLGSTNNLTLTRFYSRWQQTRPSNVSLANVTVQKMASDKWVTVLQKALGYGFWAGGSGGVRDNHFEIEDYKKEFKPGTYRWMVSAYTPSADNGTGVPFKGTNSVLTRGWLTSTSVAFTVTAGSVTNAPVAVWDTRFAPASLSVSWSNPSNAVWVNYKITKADAGGSPRTYKQGKAGVLNNRVTMYAVPSGTYGIEVAGCSSVGVGPLCSPTNVTINSDINPGTGYMPQSTFSNMNVDVYQTKMLYCGGNLSSVDASTNKVYGITSFDGMWTCNRITVNTKTMQMNSNTYYASNWPLKVKNPGLFAFGIRPNNKYCTSSKVGAWSTNFVSLTVGQMSTITPVTITGIGFSATNSALLPYYTTFNWTGIPYATNYKLVIQSAPAVGVKALNYKHIVSGPATAAAGLSTSPSMSAGITWKLEPGVTYSWYIVPVDMFGKEGLSTTVRSFVAP